MIRFFHHYIPSGILLLFLAEGLLLVAALYFGIDLRFEGLESLPKSLSPLLPKVVVFSFVMLIIMTAFGLYNWEWRLSVKSLLLRLGLSFGLGFMVMSLLFYIFPDPLFVGRGAFLMALGSGLASIFLLRLAFYRWTDIAALKTRVLVLGTGSRAAKIEEMLEKRGSAANIQVLGYHPMGGIHHFVATDRVLGSDEPFMHLVKRLQVQEIILAVRERRGGGMPVPELLECRLRGIKVLELSSFFERENGHLQLDSLNASWMILGDGFDQGVLRDTIKRMFDLIFSSLLLVATAPVMLATALLIRLESPGPILYRQVRIGQYGQPFTIFKFRSMRQDAEKDGRPQWAQQNDDRTTRVGRFIRRARIDELPQIFNVFMGDMSFVGPRPERPYFVSELKKDVPYYAARHNIKPGITGWAQVRYSYGASLEDALEKLQYDLYYVKNHSLFLDLMILLQTVQVVLLGKGAR